MSDESENRIPKISLYETDDKVTKVRRLLEIRGIGVIQHRSMRVNSAFEKQN